MDELEADFRHLFATRPLEIYTWTIHNIRPAYSAGTLYVDLVNHGVLPGHSVVTTATLTYGLSIHFHSQKCSDESTPVYSSVMESLVEHLSNPSSLYVTVLNPMHDLPRFLLPVEKFACQHKDDEVLRELVKVIRAATPQWYEEAPPPALILSKFEKTVEKLPFFSPLRRKIAHMVAYQPIYRKDTPVPLQDLRDYFTSE